MNNSNLLLSRMGPRIRRGDKRGCRNDKGRRMSPPQEFIPDLFRDRGDNGRCRNDKEGCVGDKMSDWDGILD